MKAAIEASLKSRAESNGSVPRVGAVAVIGGQIIATAYRGELAPDDHAEFTLLEKHLPSRSLVDATIYTTLEPCTERGETRTGEKKIPCFQRLIDRGVGRVVIGMLDPNPIIRGRGFRELRRAKIKTDVFPHDLMSQIEEMNRDFVRAMESNEIHHSTQSIAALAIKGKDPLQRSAVELTVADALERLRRIQKGQIPIPGIEAGYFRYWLDVVEGFNGTEQVKAYIRIPAFDPKDLLSKNVFTGFYARLRELVSAGRLSIRYIFLLGTNEASGDVAKYLDTFRDFADEVRIVDQKGAGISADQLRPSIVLFQNQRIAFTHDRGDNTLLVEADRWIFEHNYEKLSKRFAMIELSSSIYFTRSPNM